MKKFYVLLALGVLAALASCNQQKSDTATVVPLDQMSTGKEVTISLNQQTPAALEQTAASTAHAVTEEVSAAASAVVSALPTNEQIQQALKNAGLYEGSVDGVLGKKSKAAIMAFQEQNGLTADGKVGKKTWAKLATYLTAPAAPAPVAQ